jgi:hypothetical protein
MIDFYDRDGKVVDLMTWGRLHGDLSYRRIAEDTVSLYWISTVWLGIDHSFCTGPHRPVIFETMVFLRNGGMENLDEARYSTEAEARAGHEAMCAEIRAKEALVDDRHIQAITPDDGFEN